MFTKKSFLKYQLYAGILALVVGASFSVSHRAIAQTATAIQDKIENHKDSLEKLNEEIGQLKNQIDTIGKQKKTLQNEIKSIELVRQKIQKEAEITRIKAQRTNTAISSLERSIKDKQLAVARQKEAVTFAIQRIAEYDNRSMLEMLLSADSLSDAFEEADQLEQVQSSFVEHMRTLQGLTKDLETDKIRQQEEHKKAKAYSKELTEQEGLVNEKKLERTALVKETSNKESQYQAQLAEKERRKKQFEQELQQFEASLKASVDSTTFPKAGTKVFLMPIASTRITQHFGYTAAAKYLYASGKHSGTDFAAQVGTPVVSVAPGIVEATGDTDIACRGASYGKYVYVKHKNGLSTLYAHLSRISVAQGQEVGAQELLGYSGNTGYSTGPHLHLGLYVSSATKVDNVPSQSCRGAVFRMPVAPKEAYLDFENYI